MYLLSEHNLCCGPNRRTLPLDPVPLLVPQKPNEVWSADLMGDALHNGVCFLTFNVIDDFTREALCIGIDTSPVSRRLVDLFERFSTHHRREVLDARLFHCLDQVRELT